MPTIQNYGPVNRHITEYLTTDKRVKQYKCKTLQNPDYYYDGQVYAPIDIISQRAAVSKAGKINLRDRNIVSFGVKQADDAYKLFGLRPDEKQDGSEQYEVSIEGIEVSGKAQTINLRDRQAVSPIITRFGDNLYIQNIRQRCRVMVAATNADDGFKITQRIHLKGLIVTYRADLDEYWIYNSDGQFRFRIGKPYLVDTQGENPLLDADGKPYPALVKHSLTEISPGEYLYVKEPTEEYGKIILPDKFLIDSDTVYSTTADGYVQRNSGSDNTWALCHDATDGTAVDTTAVNSGTAMSASFSSPKFWISRSYFYYNLAALSGTVTDCTENLSGYNFAASNVGSLQGTQADTLTTADFDSFSGSSFGNTASWSTAGYNTITYNATGVAAAQAALGGTLKTCAREYNHDLLNVSPGTSLYRNGCYYTDNTGTANDPYVLLTVASSNVGFFQLF